VNDPSPHDQRPASGHQSEATSDERTIGTWRLVVAVSEQAGAADLVRAGRRLAEALHAPWTALHVETRRNARFGAAENARLADTLHLATQLGGAVATLPAETVVAGLASFAAEAHATHLVVGRAVKRPARFAWRHGATIDRLTAAAPRLILQVVPISAAPGPTTRYRPPQPWGAWQGYAIALVMVLAVTALGEAIFAARAVADVGLLYLLPVLVAATRYGLRTGVATGLAGSLAYNWFFIPPTGTFTIEDPQNLVTVGVLLIVAVAASQLAARVRAQALLAQTSARQNSALAGFARLLTGIGTPDELGQLLCAEIARLFDAQTVLLLPSGERPAIAAGDRLALAAAFPPAAPLETLDHAAARWAFDNAVPAGRGTDTLTACEWRFQPIAAGERALGVFGLARADAGPPVRPDRLPLLLSLLDQAGLALERIALAGEMASIERLKERDRLRAALLSSVSHDLRTPLTTILGTLAEIAPADAEQAAQLADARGEAERLNHFVANLLDMVRIESGTLGHAIEAVDLAEAIAAAVHDMRRALAGRALRIDVAPDLPLVTVDPRLFHHCLINLLDNAAKYGDRGTPVTIAARRLPRGLDLMVMDEGPGLPPGTEERVFETFTRLEGSDRKGGTGLGLAIVKGFAEAMGLDVTAANRPDHAGACFTLHFTEQHLKPGDADA